MPHRRGESVPLTLQAQAVTMRPIDRHDRQYPGDRTRAISTGEIAYASEIK
jgi:hypothetical protein